MGVARNYIFSLIWRCYGPKRDILDYWETILYFLLSYYILSKIKVYRVEKLIWENPTGTMVSVGQFCWNDGVSRTMVLIVRDMILW